MLKDNHGVWEFNDGVLRDMVRTFYCKLYSVEPCFPCEPSTWHFPALSHDEIRWLNHDVLVHEIKSAIFQMGSHIRLRDLM